MHLVQPVLQEQVVDTEGIGENATAASEPQALHATLPDSTNHVRNNSTRSSLT